MRDAMPAHEPPGIATTEDRKSVYLFPGDVFASAEPTVVTTILGSCVAVCLHDPFLAIGGMNHFLLPHQVGDSMASARFGPTAVAELLRKLEALGARRAALVAKVFGGSRVLNGSPIANAIGAKNVRVALRLLEEAGISVAVEETGGARGRKLLFGTDTGVASVRQI